MDEWDFTVYTNDELISEMERAITSGGVWKWNGHPYSHFEYVPDELWNEIKKRLGGSE